MATEVTATALFAGPDRGTIDNVVLHARRRPHHLDRTIRRASTRRRAASSSPPSSMPTTTPDRPRRRSAPSTCRWKAGSCAPRLAPRPTPYLAAASAMARSARAGCGAMMIHYTRPSGTLPLVEEAKEIARAASDVGIRIAFALAVRDQNPVVYGDSEPVLVRALRRGPQDRRGAVRPAARRRRATISS